MDRREFLKLGAMFTAAMAVNSNPVLRAAAKLAEANPLNVVFYKVREISTGHWKVKGTKYIDMPKRKFDHERFDVDTFEILEIVDNSVANGTKMRLWKEHNCKGHKGGGFNMHLYTRNGKLIGSRESTKQHMREIQKIGCRNTSNASALAQIESGQIKKFIAGGRRANEEYWANISEDDKQTHLQALWDGQDKEWLSQNGKRVGIAHRESGHIQRISKLGNKKAREAAYVKRPCTCCLGMYSGGMIKKHHNEKCRMDPKDIIPVLRSLPIVFTQGQLKRALRDAGLTVGVLVVMNNPNYVQTCHKLDGTKEHRVLINPKFYM